MHEHADGSGAHEDGSGKGTNSGAAQKGSSSDFQRFADSSWKAFYGGFQKDIEGAKQLAATVQKGVESAGKLQIHLENSAKFAEALGKRGGVKKAADAMTGEAKKQADQFIQEKKESLDKLKTLADPKATPEQKGEVFGTWAHDQVRDAAIKKVGDTGHKAFGGHPPKTAHEKVGHLDAHYTEHKGQIHVELKDGDKTVLSGRLRGRYDYENAHQGPLRGDGPDAHGQLSSKNAAGTDQTFSGYRYLDIEADGKHTLHRACGEHERKQLEAAIEDARKNGGTPTHNGGDCLSFDKPASVTAVRSEMAVRRAWTDRHHPDAQVARFEKERGVSDPTHAYEVRPPAGTPVCVGVTSNMGKGYEGGGVQVVVPDRDKHAFEIVGKPEPIQRSNLESHAVRAEKNHLRYEHQTLSAEQQGQTAGRTAGKHQAQIGDMAPYNKQGKAVLGPDGKRASEHEHVMPGKAHEIATMEPTTGDKAYVAPSRKKGAPPATEYKASMTLTVPADLARIKTNGHPDHPHFKSDKQVLAELKKHRDEKTGEVPDHLKQYTTAQSAIDRTVQAREICRAERIKAGKPTDDLDICTNERIAAAAHHQQWAAKSVVLNEPADMAKIKAEGHPGHPNFKGDDRLIKEIEAARDPRTGKIPDHLQTHTTDQSFVERTIQAREICRAERIEAGKDTKDLDALTDDRIKVAAHGRGVISEEQSRGTLDVFERKEREAQDAFARKQSEAQAQPKGFAAGVKDGVAERAQAEARFEPPKGAVQKPANAIDKGAQLADPNVSTEVKGKIVGREVHDSALRAYHERAGKSAEELGKKLGKQPESAGNEKEERGPSPQSPGNRSGGGPAR